jgi:hypothetical protein
MADATYKPIEDVALGDVVLATDPQTGITESALIVDTINGTGNKAMVKVTVADLGEQTVAGATAAWAVAPDDGDLTVSFSATDNHAVWVDSRADWVDAGALQSGDLLLAPDGTHLSVTSVEPYTDTLTVYNLTVADIHTYYILVGDTPVLVHNVGCRTFSLQTAPNTPGIYRIEFNNGRVYVGSSTTNIHQRIHAAFRDPGHAVARANLKPGDVKSITWTPTPGMSRQQIRQQEQQMIDSHGGIRPGGNAM